jgi:hypothetical protein
MRLRFGDDGSPSMLTGMLEEPPENGRLFWLNATLSMPGIASTS